MTGIRRFFRRERGSAATQLVARGAGLGLVVASIVIAIGSLPAARADTLTATRLGGAVTPTALANSLVGDGVTVSNVTYVGDEKGAGTFSGGSSAIGLTSGVVMSSGLVQSEGGDCEGTKGVEGPNGCNANTAEFDTPGDASLDALVDEGETQDAAVLEFDFVPQFGTVSFDYVFSSEEYNEFVDSQFNDVFGFFVNGTNCATVTTSEGTEPVSINTINGGNPFGIGPASNPSLYRNNTRDDPGPSTIETEMDGLTVVLKCTATVTANQSNHMKLAIADVSDASYDSAVFIGAASLVSGVTVKDNLSGGDQSGPSITVPPDTPVTDTAQLTGVNADTATGTMKYSFFSDSGCSTLAADAGTKTLGANGAVPASDPVTLGSGTYYAQSVYSGDAQHNSATSTCGDSVLTVTGTATTSSTTPGSTTSSTTPGSTTSSTTPGSTTTSSTTSTTTSSSTTSSTTSTTTSSTSSTSTSVLTTSTTGPVTSTSAAAAATSTTTRPSVLGSTLQRTGFDRAGVALAGMILLCGGALLAFAAGYRRPAAAHYISTPRG
jgi:hypothetical protein